MPGSDNIAAEPVDSKADARDLNGSSRAYRVVVCAETSTATAKIMPHAKAVAAAVDAELVLLHVIEPEHSQYSPTDPIEWDLCRREAEAFVCALSKEHELDEGSITTKVLQGRSSDQICTCVADNLNDIAALCRSDVQAPGHIGQTALRVLEGGGSSVLMVPATAEGIKEATYRRILVPLDGSATAEAAIPVAKKIARTQHAEIVLIQAIPEPFLTQGGPLETEDIELKDQLLRRNERVARDYLQRFQEDIDFGGIAVATVILTGGDVRRQLNWAIITESADFVVLASHGDSGYADAPTGDIARFLLAHSSAPVLMIRRLRDSGSSHIHSATKSRGVRRPAGAA